MQFLKKHITELCFMLLLCGTLWGAVQLIVSGHIFNGDFALYILTGTKHTIRRYAASVFGHAGDDSPFYLSALFTYTLPVGISSATISVCGIVWHQLFCLQNCRSYLSGRGFHLSLLSPYSLERAFQNVRPTRFSFADRQHILLGVC